MVAEGKVLVASQGGKKVPEGALIGPDGQPSSDPHQIASEALEMALQELADRLPSESPPDANETLSLDAAMAFLRRHTPPA